MKPQKIRALLIEYGVKQIDIARALEVSHTSLTKVIDGEFTSYRIQRAVAEKCRLPFHIVWPKAKDQSLNPKYREPLRQAA